MTERKLQHAANTLPEPKTDFLSVEEAYKTQQALAPHYQRKRRRIAWILCFALLLTGCVFGPTVPEYHLYNGDLGLLFPTLAVDEIAHLMGTDPEWKSARKEAEALGWTIPESLGGSPWYAVSKANLTTKKSNWFMAMLFHHYTQYSVRYGYEMETEITLEDGTSATANWTDRDVRLEFGSLEQDVWRRQFGFDGNDIWVGYESSNGQVEECRTVEYEGATLYVATYCYDNDFYGLLSHYGQHVFWVDYDHNTVFHLFSYDDTPDFVFSCAKELIDQIH